ncbi:MAG: ABC transporter substrate-binding protein [Defluviitaleaceae bacterium]|nr:ABC transporter substrate-binding protein [Defluviitaleaceae bacterium]
MDRKLLLLMLAFLFLFSCKKTADVKNDAPPYNPNDNGGQTVVSPQDAHESDEKQDQIAPAIPFFQNPVTLTVAAFERRSEFDKRTIDIYADRFTKDYENVTVNLIYFNKRDSYLEFIEEAMLNGTLPDLFVLHDRFAVYEPKFANCLANIEHIMWDDPGYDSEDYFLNVLEAAKFNGELLTFPLCFDFNVITANSLFVNELMKNYNEMNSATAAELISIYNSFRHELYFMHDMYMDTALFAALHDYINADGSFSLDNDRFKNFLREIKSVAYPTSFNFNLMSYTRKYIMPADEKKLSEYFLFNMKSADFFQYLISPNVNTGFLFYRPLPLVNGKRQLIVNLSNFWCISEKSDNKDAAWEFLKYMAKPIVDFSSASATDKFSVNRNDAKRYVFDLLNYVVSNNNVNFNRANPLPETEIIFDAVWETFVSFAEMPMSYHCFNYNDNNYELIESDFEVIFLMQQFFSENMTVDEAAAMMEKSFNGMIGKNYLF